MNWTVKTQIIRLADVALVGPLMIWAGGKAAEKNPVPGMALLLFGIGTIVFNGSNYLKIERARR
jgi:hypothetical protein